MPAGGVEGGHDGDRPEILESKEDPILVNRLPWIQLSIDNLSLQSQACTLTAMTPFTAEFPSLALVSVFSAIVAMAMHPDPSIRAKALTVLRILLRHRDL